jgi:hypothetical protein
MELTTPGNTVRRNFLRALAASAVLFTWLAVAHAQETEGASKQAPKVPPDALIKLIGKSRAEVEAALGTTTNVSQPTSGGVCLAWPASPNDITCIWNKSGKMTILCLPTASTWRKTLQKYGLHIAGVKPRKIKGDGGSTAYRLIGVSGLPAGWQCEWFDDSFTLSLSPAVH